MITIMKPKIVDIPVKMEKFYGKGKMLHPSIEEIEEVVKLIPKGFVITIKEVAKRLSKEFGTEVTCPMRTGNGLKKIGERYSRSTIDVQMPFWRVIRADKFVIKSKNMELSASLIENEGFTLLLKKTDSIKIEVALDQIFTFD